MVKLLFQGWRLLFTIMVIVAAAVCCRLGFWQIDRLEQRQAKNALINTRMAAEAVPLTALSGDLSELEYRRVTVTGVYDHSQEVILRPRSLDGATGGHIITPLLLQDSDQVVMVDRGWLPLSYADPEIRVEYEEPGLITVEAIVRLSESGLSGPDEVKIPEGQTRRDKWFRVDIDSLRDQTGYGDRLLPVFIEQQPDENAPFLPRRVATTDLGEGSHLSYVFQWFSFALVLVVGYPVLLYQQMKHKKKREVLPATS
jgi:surfeit locus 1 family protein